MACPASAPAPTPVTIDSPGAIAHINQMQSIITRLATQSASCKTWCLSLISAFIAFAGATKLPLALWFTLLPIVVFGFLDTMYLAQEKAYRDKHKEFAGKLRCATYTRCDAFKLGAPVTFNVHVVAALKSWAIWPDYGSLLAAFVVVVCMGLPALLAAAAK